MRKAILILIWVLMPAVIAFSGEVTPASNDLVFQAPVTPIRISAYFNPPAKRWQAGNRGIDLVVPNHEQIMATQTGVVKVARIIVDRYVITIRHHNGITTTYTHVEPVVAPGEVVKKGQTIGFSKGTFIEWGAKLDADTYINPLSLLLGKPRLVKY